MRQFGVSAILILWATLAAAFEIEEQRFYGPQDAPERIHILSTADIALFEPIRDAFVAETPGVAVDYTVVSSSDVVAAVMWWQRSRRGRCSMWRFHRLWIYG